MVYTFRKDTSIGNLEAETDTFLDECFVETNAYNNLLNFERNTNFFKRIIVGRTGSGKTALLKKLMEADSLYKEEEIEAEKTVFEYIRNNIFINELIEKKVDLRIFFKALWVHVILVKIIEILTDKDTFLDTLIRKDRKDLKEYIDSYESHFFEDEALNEITEKFTSGINSELSRQPVKVGAGINTEEYKRTQSITNNYVNRELLTKQRKIVKYLEQFYASDNKQKKIIISIDDLDKSWLLNQNVKYDFINALLDALKEFLDICSVKVIVSIRTDILEGVYLGSLRQDEKDQSLILPIEWTEREIKEVLDKRIAFLLEDHYQKKQIPTFSKIFDFEVKKELADDFILKRTMLRPRDAIEFVNYCFKCADGNTEINEKHVLEAEEYYFSSRKKALGREWQSIYPEVQTYINLIHNLGQNKFNLSNLFNIKDCIKEELLKTNNDEDPLVQTLLKHDDQSIKEVIKKLLDIWFSIGIIGIHKAQDLIVYSKFEKQHLDLSDYEKEFYIHPLFWRH